MGLKWQNSCCCYSAIINSAFQWDTCWGHGSHVDSSECTTFIYLLTHFFFPAQCLELLIPSKYLTENSNKTQHKGLWQCRPCLSVWEITSGVKWVYKKRKKRGGKRQEIQVHWLFDILWSCQRTTESPKANRHRLARSPIYSQRRSQTWQGSATVPKIQKQKSASVITW